VKRSGIYAIWNKISGRFYVGSAADIDGRWATHRNLLRSGRHHSIKLQRSWNKHGAEAFEWLIVEMAGPDRLIEREQHWMDHYGSADPRRGFNIAKTAGSRRGVKVSAASVAKMMAARAAWTPEQKAALAEKFAAARRGYRHPPETLAKMRGQKRTAETKRRIGEAHRGRPKSAEQRAKIAATLTGRKIGPQSAETIAKRVAATRATKEARRAQ
jgi:group I intron endonuclease